MPVNMPTHGHGQGYADINFLIPELIQSVNVRKGPYFADVGDFASAGSARDRLPQQAAEKHRGDDHWQFRLSPRAGGGINRRRCGYAARRHRRRQIQRPVGRTGQCAQDQRRDALQPGHRDRRADADGDGLFQRLELDRSGGAARHRSGHHRPVRYARSDRWRRFQPLQPVRQFCAFERVRPEQDQCLCRALRPAALQQFHLFPRQSRQWRPVQPARPPHPRRLRRAACLRLAIWRLRDANPRRHAEPLRRHPCRSVQDGAARAAFDRARGSRAGRQCRHLDGHDDALDRLAAHHGRHPRGHLCRTRPQRHAGKFRQRTGVDDEPEGRHRAWPLVQDRVLRQCRLRPALQRHPRRDDHGRSRSTR